ncbi:MAG: HupE/UreJ family protein, partial [Pseudomonadota bacterium]
MDRRLMGRAFGFLLAVFLCGAQPLAADELRPAVLEFSERQNGTWSLDWKLPVADPRTVSTENPVIPETCEFVREPVKRAAPLALFGNAELRCEGEVAGQSFGLASLGGRADAIARFVPLDAPTQTFRLTAAAPLAMIAADPDSWQVARSYFWIGVEHILLGWDHLLFVIALVLLVRRPWP